MTLLHDDLRLAVPCLACPQCRARLEPTDDGVWCDECRLNYPVQDGAIDFLSSLDHSFSDEPSRAALRDLAREIELYGLEQTIPRLIARSSEFGLLLAGTRRVDWLAHCYDVDKADCCIDLGSGLGSEAFLLRHFYRHVWSVEPGLERIAIQNIRARHESAANVHFVRASGPILPFADGIANLVVVNGGCDQYVSSFSRGSGRHAQVAFLEEVRRVLKPDGVLYLGVKNRTRAASVWHGGARRGVPWQEGLSAAATSRAEAGGRTARYGYSDYLSLLRGAGFQSVTGYWANDERRPWFSGRLEDGGGVADFLSFYARLRAAHPARTTRDRLKIWIARAAPSPPMRRFLAWAVTHWSPSFLIFASSFDFKPVETRLFGSFGQFLFRVSGSERTGKNLFFMKGATGGQVIKIARFPDERLELEQAESTRAAMNRQRLTVHRWGAVTALAEAYVTGRPLRIFSLADNHLALRWLLAFQRDRDQGAWQRAAWTDVLQQYQSRVFPLLDPNLHTVVDRACADLTELGDRFLPRRVPEHGDFAAVNLSVEAKGQLHVRDWEHYVASGDDLFDLCHFLILNSSLEGKKAGRSLERNWAGSGRYSRILVELIREWCAHTAAGPEAIMNYVPIMFARVIARSKPATRFWTDSYVVFQELFHAWSDAHRQIRSFVIGHMGSVGS